MSTYITEDGSTYPEDIYLLQITDPVQGGEDGPDNRPHIELANRTAYLKAASDQATSDIAFLRTQVEAMDSLQSSIPRPGDIIDGGGA